MLVMFVRTSKFNTIHLFSLTALENWSGLQTPALGLVSYKYINASWFSYVYKKTYRLY